MALMDKILKSLGRNATHDISDLGNSSRSGSNNNDSISQQTPGVPILPSSWEYENPDMGPKRDPLQIVIPLTIVYGLIFVTGIVGNISTCIVIKKNRSMHTATNYYLFSLAISDFLLLISGVPQEVYLIWSRYPYVFGEYFCIGRGILAETSANATVLTITAFTVERYVAICHPFLSQAISKLSRAIRIIVIIWIVSIVTAIPQALQFGILNMNGVPRCMVVRVILQHSFQLSTYIFFIVPMSIIFVLYLLIGLHLYRSDLLVGRGTTDEGSGSHQFAAKDAKRLRGEFASEGNVTSHNVRGRGRIGIKSVQSDTILYRYSGGQQQGAARGRLNQFGTKRVLKMLVAVVICFFICWAPFHAQRLFAVYWSSVMSSDTSDSDFNDDATEASKDDAKDNHEAIYAIMTYISGVLYYLSTCINPLLYNLMSNKFRQAFKAILFGKTLTNQRRSQNSQRSMSRKPTLNSSSAVRGSIESEMQSKASLLQTTGKIKTPIVP